jgi:TonB family protein
MKKENKIRTLTIIIMLVLALVLLSCGKTTKTPDATTSAYTQVDEMPTFPHGDSALIDFISKNTKYPEEAKKANIDGCVVVRFIVEENCSISNVVIIKSLSPILDTEALKVIRNLPNFEKPATINGKPVSVYYMIPITFTLK